MAKRGRRISASRRRRVTRIAARLRDAIDREPFLRRFPPLSELAEMISAPLREVRYAMKQLAEEGWVESGASGYRVVRQAAALRWRLQNVVFVQHIQHATVTFDQVVAFGADRYCDGIRANFQTRWLRGGEAELMRLREKLPGRQTGWIFMLPPPKELLLQWRQDRRPIVIADHVHPDLPAPTVLLDLAGAAKIAVEYLRGLGHERIAVVASSWGRAGSAFSGLGFGPQDILALTAGTDEQLGARFAESWTQQWRESSPRPTALICHSLEPAMVFLRVLHQRGVRVPQELSIVALGAAFGDEATDMPQLTHAASGSAIEMGETAVRLLDESEQKANAVVVLPPALRNEGLTAGPPGE